MKSYLTWEDNIIDREKNKVPVYSICFSPDGLQLLAAAGSQILIYNASNGNLLQTMKSHKDAIFAIDYSKNGKRFASGGADKTVIIWSSLGEGLVKYTHNDIVQDVAFDPNGILLVSCSANDFGLWSDDVKTVPKIKINARALCVSWSLNGHCFGLGMYEGTVSIRNRSGEEKARIQHGSSPIYSLAWNPTEKLREVIVVGDSEQKIAMYHSSGKQIGKERSSGCDIMSITIFAKGDLMVIGGSDKKANCYTFDGLKMMQLSQRPGWILSQSIHPKQTSIAFACSQGSIACYQLSNSVVHGLYDDRYAYRDSMTDVIIQHLSNHQKAKIKCRDLIKRIALYKDKLAVQLKDKVLIYEVEKNEPSEIHYKLKDKMDFSMECSLLVITSFRVILCLEKKLNMINFQGEFIREWTFDSTIRYIKCIGGPSGKETILVGLKSGMVLLVCLDNPFYQVVVQHSAAIKCLDLSLSNKKLAVVDENSVCFIYDVNTKEVLEQEPNATSVAWNSDADDMYCFTGPDTLSIKAGDFPLYRQNLKGFVVGFKGAKIFCLCSQKMVSIDVSQSATMERYIARKQFEDAYRAAALGVTENDWKKLAIESLAALAFDTALKAFTRIRDFQYLSVMKELLKKVNIRPEYVKAEILLLSTDVIEAAKLFQECGDGHRAVEILTDMGLFDNAQKTANQMSLQGDVKEILKKKAADQELKKDLLAAANTYLEVGEKMQAIIIFGENGWMDKLLNVSRSLNKMETECLKKCLYYFRKCGQSNYASEVLVRMGDVFQLVQLYVEMQNWEDAFRIAENDPKLVGLVYKPYAEALMIKGEYEMVCEYLSKAGYHEESIKTRMRMIKYYLARKSYDIASRQFFILSSTGNLKPQVREQFEKKAEFYFAFAKVYSSIEEPFTVLSAENIFSTCCFLLQKSFEGSLPDDISLGYVLFCLFRSSKSLGAFRTALYCLDRLQSISYPASWRDEIEVSLLSIQTYILNEAEEVLPICYRCSHMNPAINPQGDICVNCGIGLVRSFYGFDILPLIEFKLSSDCSHEDVIQLPQNSSKTVTDNEDDYKDPFSFHNSATGSISQPNITLNKMQLSRLKKQEIFVLNLQNGHRYFKHTIPEIPVVKCDSCNHLFHAEDFQLAVLELGSCPFCGSNK